MLGGGVMVKGSDASLRDLRSSPPPETGAGPHRLRVKLDGEKEHHDGPDERY